MSETGLAWVRVWDAPTRLFHWGVVVMVATAWVTQQVDWMTAHMINGYAMFAALLFRFSWGFLGSDTARFRSFLRSPAAALAHLAQFRGREPDREIGHNAAGGWMVLVMLLLLGLQVGTGLCANNDIDFEGPFAEAVGKGWSDSLTHVHALTFTAIEVAVLLHVAAVAAYALIRRHDLVRPMLTGRKRLPPPARPPHIASPLRAALLAAVSGLIVAVVVSWA